MGQEWGKMIKCCVVRAEFEVLKKYSDIETAKKKKKNIESSAYWWKKAKITPKVSITNI